MRILPELLKNLNPNLRLVIDFDGVLTRLPVDWQTLIQTVNRSLDIPLETPLSQTFLYARATHRSSDYFTLIREAEVSAAKTALSSPLAEELHHHRQPFAIVSGNTRAAITVFLQRMRLLPLCSNLITCEDVGFLKPHPEGILKIVGSQSPAEFMYIGDTLADEIAGRLAGVHFVHYEYKPTVQEAA